MSTCTSFTVSTFLLLVEILIIGGAAGSNNSTIPRHVHLSFGADPKSTIVVTWSTLNSTSSSTVRYGLKGALNMEANGTATKFVDGGLEKSTQYIHRATLRNLNPGEVYSYQCGGILGKSPVYQFRTFQTGENNMPLRLAVYGDLGVKNAQSLPRLKDDVEKYSMYDAILHVGDFAYDMADDNGKKGDEFMNLIEPIAARLPYMTTVGNHEWHHNFSNYKNRFSMPGSDENMFYSYNLGPLHIISISTEFYFFVTYGFQQISRQYQWLEADLLEASRPENRKNQPWIVFLAHRPIYCSNNERNCGLSAEYLRNGIPIIHLFGLEKLLHKYGVDIAIWAHEHSYERLWPVYRSIVLNGTTVPAQPYTDPRATVHFITGSAGCQERHDAFHLDQIWSAFHSEDYGYSRMTVYNQTHIHWSQLSDDKNGTIIDEVWVIKNHHGPFPN